MKYFLLLVIKIYWFLKSKKAKPKCIFKKSCSKYIYDITKNEGFWKGIKALNYRFRNCRSNFQVNTNSIDGEIEILLASGQSLKRYEISNSLLNQIETVNI